jgi:hypothetical protein
VSLVGFPLDKVIQKRRIAKPEWEGSDCWEVLEEEVEEEVSSLEVGQ